MPESRDDFIDSIVALYDEAHFFRKVFTTQMALNWALGRGLIAEYEWLAAMM